MVDFSSKTWKHLGHYILQKCPKCGDTSLYFVGESTSLEEAGFIEEDLLCKNCGCATIYVPYTDWTQNIVHVAQVLIDEIHDESAVELIKQIVPSLSGSGVTDDLILRCLDIFGEALLSDV